MGKNRIYALLTTTWSSPRVWIAILRMCYWRFWPSLVCCHWSRPDNICKVLILVTPQWLWTGAVIYRAGGDLMESGDQPVISDIRVIRARGQSEQAPATFSQSEAGRVEIKTSCVGANKWSVVNSVLAEAPPSWPLWPYDSRFSQMSRHHSSPSLKCDICHQVKIWG